jgi:cell filamentation protein, protein adenylyltransferase
MQNVITIFIFETVITATDVTRELEVIKQTAHSLIQDFEKLGILKKETGYKRNRIFVSKII